MKLDILTSKKLFQMYKTAAGKNLNMFKTN